MSYRLRLNGSVDNYSDTGTFCVPGVACQQDFLRKTLCDLSLRCLDLLDLLPLRSFLDIVRSIVEKG